jgi:hypothetical protein
LNRRRPIPRTRLKPEFSQHYETILGGAVRVYKDGREVCNDSSAGWKEYSRRIDVMLARQGNKCKLCGRRLYRVDATFEHQRRRGMGSAWRDDRITKDGQEWNSAAHWICNTKKG